jgi:hypothetical protein
MTKCHKTVEVIRGVPTGRPKFANATLRTTDPSTLAGATFDFRVSDYFKQLVGSKSPRHDEDALPRPTAVAHVGRPRWPRSAAWVRRR